MIGTTKTANANMPVLRARETDHPLRIMYPVSQPPAMLRIVTIT